MSKKTRNSCLLVLTALIWGIAFVAQSEGGDAVGPYTFNSIRSFIGSAFLVPVIFLLDKTGRSRKPETPEQKKILWIGGICCGIVLCVASNFQQLGLTMGTPAGKAGFLTACYIILVPLLGLFLKKKCSWNIWIGVVLTVLGLYLLCMTESSFSLQTSDILVMICALCFSVHILVIDHFSPMVDGVRMSCIQFLVCGLLTAVPMLIYDLPHMGASAWLSAFGSSTAWITILYAGIMSCGIAYTLQIVGQEGVNPTIASLLMSLESVFSVLAGWVILGQTLGPRELMGCVVIFAAVVLAQIPVGKK